jgi:hypothetical protein
VPPVCMLFHNISFSVKLTPLPHTPSHSTTLPSCRRAS